MFAPSFFLLIMWLPAFAFAQERVFELVLKDHKFNIERIEVKAGEKFKIKVKNNDKVFEEFESNAMSFEKFLKPGAEVTVHLGPLKPGEYPYFAEFNKKTGNGIVVVTP
jgi:plastocyanin